MDGYENEYLFHVLLIEQAGVVFGIRFGAFISDDIVSVDPPVCPLPTEPTQETS